jgi:hypothetical protein
MSKYTFLCYRNKKYQKKLVEHKFLIFSNQKQNEVQPLKSTHHRVPEQMRHITVLYIIQLEAAKKLKTLKNRKPTEAKKEEASQQKKDEKRTQQRILGNF